MLIAMDPSIKVSSTNGPRVLAAMELALVATELVLAAMELALVATELVLVAMELVQHQATNPRRTVALAMVQALVSPLPSTRRQPMEALVDLVPQAQLVTVVPRRTIHRHRSNHQDTVLVLVLDIQDQPASEVKDMRRRRHRSAPKVRCKPTPPMLKVSSKILTHKSSVARHQVVFKPTHKTSKFASSNHHPFHHQAYVTSLTTFYLHGPIHCFLFF